MNSNIAAMSTHATHAPPMLFKLQKCIKKLCLCIQKLCNVKLIMERCQHNNSYNVSYEVHAVQIFGQYILDYVQVETRLKRR